MARECAGVGELHRAVGHSFAGPEPSRTFVGIAVGRGNHQWLHARGSGAGSYSACVPGIRWSRQHSGNSSGDAADNLERHDEEIGDLAWRLIAEPQKGHWRALFNTKKEC